MTVKKKKGKRKTERKTENISLDNVGPDYQPYRRACHYLVLGCQYCHEFCKHTVHPQKALLLPVVVPEIPVAYDFGLRY